VGGNPIRVQAFSTEDLEKTDGGRGPVAERLSSRGLRAPTRGATVPYYVSGEPGNVVTKGDGGTLANE